MISLIRGALVTKTGDLITVMTESGVGYELSVPLGVLERLPRVGDPVELYTALVVREDDWSLFGFDTSEERSVFQRVLQANGVGPRLALALLSALGPDRVVKAVRDGDIAVLQTVPGVGKKKAERIVLELKDRMRDLQTRTDGDGAGPVPEQATAALARLGYAATDAEAAVRAVIASKGTVETPELIREALQRLTHAR